MGREDPPDQADPAAEPDDLGQDAAVGTAAERSLIQPVDLALDVLDHLEVVGEHLVDDGRHERAGVEGAQSGLAFAFRVETDQCLQRAVVDGDHPVPTADDVDRPGDRVALRVTVRFGVDREQDQVDGAGVLGQVRTFRRRGEAVDQPGLHAGRRGHAREVLRRATVEVDPEELVVLEAAGHALGQLDLTILPVGVVQARLRAARGAGRRDQRYAVSRTATMMARIAIPYCKTVIA